MTTSILIERGIQASGHMENYVGWKPHVNIGNQRLPVTAAPAANNHKQWLSGITWRVWRRHGSIPTQSGVGPEPPGMWSPFAVGLIRAPGGLPAGDSKSTLN